MERQAAWLDLCISCNLAFTSCIVDISHTLTELYITDIHALLDDWKTHWYVGWSLLNRVGIFAQHSIILLKVIRVAYLFLCFHGGEYWLGFSDELLKLLSKGAGLQNVIFLLFFLSFLSLFYIHTTLPQSPSLKVKTKRLKCICWNLLYLSLY